MAESGQEKTEAATPKRREDARTEGRIPRSQELTTAVMLLGSALVLNAAAPALSARLIEIFGIGLGTAAAAPLDATGATALVRGLGLRTMQALILVVGSMAAIAVATGAMQARGVLTTKPLGPNWGRLNPLQNGKRMIGVTPWAELVKSLTKLLIVSLAVYWSLRAAWPDMLALAQQSPFGLVAVTRQYAVRLLATAGFSYLALALLDYLYQLWDYERGLKMSREDIKQEVKQSEGDQMMKARVRSFGRQLARRQMFRDVPTADVVLVNPTHIAIALKYDPSVAPAPLVVAMGERKVAERIKKLAFEHGVPVIENRPLARALIAAAHVGTMIPPELYAAVAEVLAFVIRQRTALGMRWAGSATA